MLRDTTCNFIVNQTLAGLIGAEEVLGMEINFMGARGSIVGIMEDYHFHHLSNQVEPLVVAPVTTDNLGHMIIRLAPGNADVTLRGIEEKWKELLPDYPLTYEYVEEAIDAMYGSEARMASLIGIFSLVAIIIAASGLFALASFTAERRIREIGIRKTFGAADSQISGMMIRDFSLYIGISLVISLPLVWFIARSWLDDFHFRIPLKADLFLLTAVITTAVSVLTVLYHSLRAARIDPVEALRYE
ncbi:MAG: FtsX-like permease family protein [Bacteroidetes bacterium]|nr:MAG: FtsX-like permease family protein [Bacteroidota bacterium]